MAESEFKKKGKKSIYIGNEALLAGLPTANLVEAQYGSNSHEDGPWKRVYAIEGNASIPKKFKTHAVSWGENQNEYRRKFN